MLKEEIQSRLQSLSLAIVRHETELRRLQEQDAILQDRLQAIRASVGRKPIVHAIPRSPILWDPFYVFFAVYAMIAAIIVWASLS